MADRTPQIPALMPGAVYTRAQLENNLRKSPNTITEWLRQGMKPLPGAGRGMLFLADDVIAFLKNPGAAEQGEA
jgi:hypothetical protein